MNWTYTVIADRDLEESELQTFAAAHPSRVALFAARGPRGSNRTLLGGDGALEEARALRGFLAARGANSVVVPWDAA